MGKSRRRRRRRRRRPPLKAPCRRQPRALAQAG